MTSIRASSGRPVVAVVTTYFGLFDEGMPADFRAERLTAAQEVHQLLDQVADCTHVSLVDSFEAAVEAVTALGGSYDAVVIVPTMATPPEWAVSVARSLSPTPVVVLAVRERDDVPPDFDTTQATRFSLLVGVSMLTNALLRESLPYDLVLTTKGDGDSLNRLRSSLAAARAAATVRRSRLLAFGDPIPGYTDVEASDVDLTKLGAARARVSGSDVSRWASATTDPEIETVVGIARELGNVGVDDDVLRRAALVACVVRRAVAETGATAGAINCHGHLVRRNPDLGVTACLALTLLARDGVMLSCTGDLPAALALVLGRAVAGAALYCELYAVDRPGDWILVANGGEGDAATAVPGSVRLLPEEHYSGVHGAGVAVAFEVANGPATLMSLTPLASAHGGWRLVLAEGEVLGSRHPSMEGPNAMVRFDGAPALAAYTAWCEAGASHHAALLPGRHAATVALAARLLGIEAVTVT